MTYRVPASKIQRWQRRMAAWEDRVPGIETRRCCEWVLGCIMFLLAEPLICLSIRLFLNLGTKWTFLPPTKSSEFCLETTYRVPGNKIRQQLNTTFKHSGLVSAPSLKSCSARGGTVEDGRDETRMLRDGPSS
ncbi:uncharacterized protein ARMOST_19363 [Armillaria ostoyae]|uniref:Uncharacterized protein n=1 Tax=Armillaria ostoyae TaxID=47428 RepID=A0A284S4E4_ARMOS|nr:uncharacterized protein ARMOST_19363 [Armillaria ostoyae]